MSSIPSSSFSAAIAASAYINTLRFHRAVLWRLTDDTWMRITHSQSVPMLRSIALPDSAYIISEEFIDIHGVAYDSMGAVLGQQPVKGMLREAHPHVKWVDPSRPDPFPWLAVEEIHGDECVAPFGVPDGWISRFVTITSGLAEAPEEDEGENEESEGEEESVDMDM
jgi:hypothetical protein